MEDPTTVSGGPKFYGPTEDPATCDLQSKKRKSDDAFDRAVFVGTAKFPLVTQFERRKLDSSKNPMSEIKTVGKKSVTSQEFWDKHKLHQYSRYHHFFAVFVPFELTSKWNSYTTTNAQQENVGHLGRPNGLYPDWKPFSTQELCQHIGVRMLHGISPTPQLSMKFKPQSEDAVNGNNFVYRCMGPNVV